MTFDRKITLLIAAIVLITLALFAAALTCLFSMRENMSIISIIAMVSLLFGLICTDIILYCLLQEEVETRKRYEERRKNRSL